MLITLQNVETKTTRNLSIKACRMQCSNPTGASWGRRSCRSGTQDIAGCEKSLPSCALTWIMLQLLCRTMKSQQYRINGVFVQGNDDIPTSFYSKFYNKRHNNTAHIYEYRYNKKSTCKHLHINTTQQHHATLPLRWRCLCACPSSTAHMPQWVWFLK